MNDRAQKGRLRKNSARARGARVRLLAWRVAAQQRDATSLIGQELAMPRHLQDGDEFRLSPLELIEYGKKLFTANWPDQDGGGRR